MAENKWKDEFIFDAYEAAKQGLDNAQIGVQLGVSKATFSTWVQKKPLLQEALKRGREFIPGEGNKNFLDYVHKRMPEELQDLWNEINACEKLRNGMLRVRALINGQGTKTKQHLFLYAFVDSHFSAAEACRRLAIPRRILNDWTYNDPDFAHLMDEIHECKKDYFEGALVRKVKEGDIGAILFVNRTLNRDRGYGDKLQVEHSGKITTETRQVSVLELDLPHEVKRLIYDAMKRKEKEEEAAKLMQNAPEMQAIPFRKQKENE